MDSLKLKFKSGNNIPVTEARITRQEFDDIQDEIANLQAKLDSVMLEYCPGDMTDDQMKAYEASQVSATSKQTENIGD